MKADHETISKSLLLYAKYLKIMDIKNRPIIVFTKQEYFSIIKQHQIRSTNTRVNKRLGECRYGFEGQNDIIFIHTDNIKQLTGMEELGEIKLRKETKRYKYYYRPKIVTSIEHTLIHELVHAKDRKLRHGKKFDYMIDYYYRKGNR